MTFIQQIKFKYIQQFYNSVKDQFFTERQL